MSQAHIGIDLGTSAVKVLALGPDGAVLSRASRSYGTASPRPGWSEQDPAAWWRATSEALREVVDGCPVPIASVGLSGQLNSFVLLDTHGASLGRALIWLDQRAAAETTEIAADHPGLRAATGNDLSAICVLPKLLWLHRRRPEMLTEARLLLPAKDYIRFRLTGEAATDPSDAISTFLTGLRGEEWAPGLVRVSGLDPACLPPIRAATERGGTVTAAAASDTGLTAGTPVAVGAGDVTALGVGCGVVAPGRVAITLGTAGHVVALGPSPVPPAGHGVWTLPHAVPGHDLWLGLIMSGGLSLDWTRRLLGGAGAPPGFDAVEGLARTAPPGAQGVSFLPFLEGVATPFNRPDARGAFLGLSAAHGAGDLVRAVMEGVAFNALDCIDALETGGAGIDEVRLAEGGAQSHLWCQVIADALERPVLRIAERDTSAIGAALCGRAMAEGVALADIADASVRFDRAFDPAPSPDLSDARARYRAHVRRALDAT